MGGALARSLTAAVSCKQEGGTVETLNSGKSSGEGGGKLDVGADEWAEEVANEVEMAGVAGSERSTTLTPTPARLPSETPVPVTPTKGKKRMAMGTPRPNRHTRPAVRPMPAGFAAALALEQILAAIAGVEQKMEKKVMALEARMMEGMEALAADENEREARVAARLMVDAEERDARLAVKLLTSEGIEREMLAKANWDIKQWTDLAQLMQRRRVEIGEIKKAVEGIAVLAAGGPTLHPRAGLAAVEPEAMEGVVATRQKEIKDEVEEWSDMEGVERGGLFGSKHAPVPGEPVSSMPPGPTTEEKEKKGKEKGKGKAVQIVAPPAMGRAARQRKRQAAGDAAKTRKSEEPVAPIRSILKRPETAEAEKKEWEKKREEEAVRKEAEKVGKKEEEKAAAVKRWEEGKLSQEEGETYSAAARPIRDLADDANAIEEVAAGQRIAHMAGMQVLGSQWEEDWARSHAASPQQQCQQQQCRRQQ